MDAFVWMHADIPGIDLRLITHKLSVDSLAKPGRQKRRTFVVIKNQAIVEEVNKLLKAGFIHEVIYPD